MAYIHNIKKYDMENSFEGATTSIWFNHCPHKCLRCWNEETWERNECLFMDNDAIVDETLEALDKHFPKNLSLLGGDPLSPLNLKDTTYIVKKIKEARPSTKIACWTGFSWEQLQSRAYIEILPLLDIVVDGRYIEELRVTGRKFGSSNQRIINVKKSIEEKAVYQLFTF